MDEPTIIDDLKKYREFILKIAQNQEPNEKEATQTICRYFEQFMASLDVNSFHGKEGIHYNNQYLKVIKPKFSNGDQLSFCALLRYYGFRFNAIWNDEIIELVIKNYPNTYLTWLQTIKKDFITYDVTEIKAKEMISIINNQTGRVYELFISDSTKKLDGLETNRRQITSIENGHLVGNYTWNKAADKPGVSSPRFTKIESNMLPCVIETEQEYYNLLKTKRLEYPQLSLIDQDVITSAQKRIKKTSNREYSLRKLRAKYYINR